MKRFPKFLLAEDGAITVDWVLLTAAVLLLGVVTAIPTFDGVVSATENLAVYISTSVESSGAD